MVVVGTAAGEEVVVAGVAADKVMESASFEDGIITLVCSAIERQGGGVMGHRGGDILKAGRIDAWLIV